MRLESKKKDQKKIKLIGLLNKTLMILALCALILEFVVFSLDHWFIDMCLSLQLAFLTFNLCLVILNPDSQKFWLSSRLYSIYVPFGVLSILTII